MINGAHVVIYSQDAAADRNFLRDVLRFSFVDVHGGWLIFKLPPAEVAVHPSDGNDARELFLLTDDIENEVAALRQAGVQCEDPVKQSWGYATRIELPGGGSLGLYQPRHNGRRITRPEISRDLRRREKFRKGAVIGSFCVPIRRRQR